LTQSYLTKSEKILPIYGHMNDENNFLKLTHDFTEGIPYNPNATLKIGPLTISFLKTKHSVPCYGMRISDGYNSIVYSAGTSYQVDWFEFSKHADFLITDCNFYVYQDGSQSGHMICEEDGKIEVAAHVKEIL